MFDDGTEIGKEKHNFLAAYHTLKFSKTDKDDIEVVDIERRCLATKYLAAKQFDSKDMALCLLDVGLKDYQSLMENKNGVNNYWKQFKALTPKIANDPQKWASGLKDLSVALDFVKPLPCQKDNTMPCQKRVISDKSVENILKLWQNRDQSLRNRKVNTQGKSSISQCLSTNEKLKIQNNNGQNTIGHSFISSTTVTNRNNTQQITCTNKQVSQFEHVTEMQNQGCEQPNYFDSMSKSKLMRGDSFNQIRNNCVQFNAGGNNAISKSQVCPQSNEEEVDTQNAKPNYFKSARTILSIQQMKANKPAQKKTLGGKVSANAQFVCPLKRDKEKSAQDQNNMYDNECSPMEMEDDRLKNIEPKMVELIKNEIMDSKATICWDDIAGLESPKKIIMEVVVYPMLRPDIFTGLRRPPKGILLFGPPGTGKTLIGKCIASQSKSTFFSISASSLTSKWIGEGEKMVRALFAVARVYQPSVIFVDEIDSLLTQRSETEHESSRRLKTEFLVQLDGAATSDDDRILIVGATNRPHELDEAARRRLVKRLYVPLPELQARKQIINNLLLTVPHNLTEEDIMAVAQQSKGYSGADMSNLCKEASMGPIRSIPFSQLENIRTEDVRQVTIDDFRDALINVRPSVSESSLSAYVEWDAMYGSRTAQNCKT